MTKTERKIVTDSDSGEDRERKIATDSDSSEDREEDSQRQ